MIKLIKVVVAGMMMLASQAFAGNGDLIVDGKLGVGTLNPQSKLEIQGASNVRITETVPSGTNGLYSDILLRGTFANYPPDTNRRNVGLIRSGFSTGVWNTGYLSFGVAGSDCSTDGDTDPCTRMIIANNGSVGIGTTTPDSSHKLTVEGSALARNGIWEGSDAKLKKNILPISGALSKVLQLGGVSYEWKEVYFKVKKTVDSPEEIMNKSPEGKHYGVIAQEVEKVLPELVKEDAEGTKAVSYTGIIPVLIEAIKEQQKMIEALKVEVTQLKSTYLNPQ